MGAALRKRQIAANIKAGRALGLSRIVGDEREAVEPGGGGDDRIGRAYGLAGSAQFSPHARRFIQHDGVDGQHDEPAQIGLGLRVGGEAGQKLHHGDARQVERARIVFGSPCAGLVGGDSLLAPLERDKEIGVVNHRSERRATMRSTPSASKALKGAG